MELPWRSWEKTNSRLAPRSHTSYPGPSRRGRHRSQDTTTTGILPTLFQPLAKWRASVPSRFRERSLRPRVVAPGRGGQPRESRGAFRQIQGRRVWAVLGAKAEVELLCYRWRKFPGEIGDIDRRGARPSWRCLEVFTQFRQRGFQNFSRKGGQGVYTRFRSFSKHFV